MSNHTIPRASENTILETIIGYYKSSGDGESVSHNAASEEVSASADAIRRQNKFLEEIKLLSTNDGNLSLSSQGRDIGRALAFDKESKAKELLRHLLNQWDATAEFLESLGSDLKTKEELKNDLAYLTETELSTPRKRAGINGLIDLYVWAGILSVSDGDKYSVAEEVATVKEEEEITESDSPSAQMQDTRSMEVFTEEQPSTVNLASDRSSHFEVHLNVSSEDDPDSVEELIKRIRKAVNEDITGDEPAVSK